MRLKTSKNNNKRNLPSHKHQTQHKRLSDHSLTVKTKSKPSKSSPKNHHQNQNKDQQLKEQSQVTLT